MHYSKEHEVLESIFVYLIKQGRKDLVDAYNEAAKLKITGKICTARKKWRCSKCKKVIQIGDKYFCQTNHHGAIRGSIFVTRHVCLTCYGAPKEQQLIKQNCKFKFIGA